MSELRVPRSDNEATLLGLDVDGEANDAFDGVDNALGHALARVSLLLPGVDAAAATTVAVDRGEILLLARLGASEPLAPGRGTLTFDVGADPMPAACASPTDPACRRHLAGDGSFTLLGAVAPGTPLDGEVLVENRFAGDGGTYVLPMAISADGPIARLPVMLGASDVELSASGLVLGRLAGAIRQADLARNLYPAFHAAFPGLIDADCPVPRAPPDCNCRAGSTGAAALSSFDIEPPRDCQVSGAEVAATFESGLISPDIDTDGDGVADAVSVGVSYTAVAATIRP